MAEVFSSATQEQKKVRIGESSHQMAADDTRATQQMRTSMRGSSSKQYSLRQHEMTGGSRFTATEVSSKTATGGDAKNQILLEIKNQLLGLQSQMVSFESKIENKIVSLENNQKELLGKVEAIESKQ